jgi:hypothetical protein
VNPEQSASSDPAARWIAAANHLLDQRRPQPEMVTRLIDGLEALRPRALVRFDEQARSYYTGIQWSKVPGLRGGDEANRERRSVRDLFVRPGAGGSAASDASVELWGVLALVSGDGYERERATGVAPLRPVIVRLLVLRCIDWVSEVRAAAQDRLEGCPPRVLVDALALADQLAVERARGEVLSSLLDARVSAEDLRHACRDADPRTRRAAWRRLVARRVATPRELADVAARDDDIVVRGIAAAVLQELPVDARRRLAEVLVDDRVGSVAVPALAALVKLDGTPPVLAALTGRSPALRRAARDWAAIRGVDARGVYLERLADDPGDAIALIGLAEVGGPRDEELFHRMLWDQRARVRAAGLRALAQVDRPAGRRAALEALSGGVTGRVSRTAANILRDGTPSEAEISIISRIALDRTKTPGQRFRSLSLLRAARWPYLAVMLESREMAEDENVRRRLDAEIRAWVGSSGRISHGPDTGPRERIKRLLPTVGDGVRQKIEFVLRTSA